MYLFRLVSTICALPFYNFASIAKLSQRWLDIPEEEAWHGQSVCVCVGGRPKMRREERKVTGSKSPNLQVGVFVLAVGHDK